MTSLLFRNLNRRKLNIVILIKLEEINPVRNSSRIFLPVFPLIAGLVLANPVFASTTPGSSCLKAGQSVVTNGEKFICSLVWVSSGVKTVASVGPKINPLSKIGIAQSKDFALISVQFSSDGLGSAQATARIENTSSKTHGAFFNITIFASDGITPAINLMGVSDSVGPGETQTVSFQTTDGDLPSGQFKYAFQTSTEL